MFIHVIQLCSKRMFKNYIKCILFWQGYYRTFPRSIMFPGIHQGSSNVRIQWLLKAVSGSKKETQAV